MKNGELPAGWESLPFTKTLNKSRHKIKKLKKSQYKNTGKYPVVDQGQEIIAGFTDEEEFLYPGDLPVIIFGDHTRIFKFIDFPFVIGADGAKALSPDTNLFDPNFFYYSLLNLNIEDRGYSRHYRYLKEKKVLHPPLPTQRRIVEILEKANAVRKKRHDAGEKTSQILQAAFVKMFGDPVRNEMGWEVVELEDVALLQRGKFAHRPRNEPRFYGGDIPFIQINDIPTSKMYIDTYSQTLNEDGLKISKLFPKDTIVIAIAATIGNVGILNFNSCFPDSLVGITPNKRLTTKEYIYFFMTYQKKTLEHYAPLTAQRNINLKILNNIKIPLPPLELQQKFAELVEKIEAMRERQAETREKVENTFQALMQKAFRGELVV
jgi:type I restriction enzyme S subunit